jgi:hypothetical protein
MSASAAPEFDAIAFQLAAALEQYDLDTARMVAGWPDLDLYREVSAQVDRIRMYSSSLPEARVQWVELLIAHAELVHLLWRGEYGGGRVEKRTLQEVRDHHSDCVTALRNRCLRVIARAR